MESVIQCHVCEDNNRCFQDEQEGYTSYMCFNCGFMSDSRFSKEHEDKVKQDSAQLINKLKVWDDFRQIYWYPSVVNMGKLGIIYPDGTLEDWKWKYAKTVPVPKEKQKALSNYSMMLDVDNAVEYERTDFLSAVKEMGIAKDIK